MQMCIKEDIKRSHSPQAGKKLLLSGKEPHPEPTQGSWAPAPNILCPAIPSSTHLLSEAVGAAAGPQLQGSPVLVAPDTPESLPHSQGLPCTGPLTPALPSWRPLLPWPWARPWAPSEASFSAAGGNFPSGKNWI